MIILPALIGGALAFATGAVLWRAGMLARPGVIGIILVAIAGFWPLFAATAQNGGQLAMHLAIFAGFGAVALFSARIGLAGLAAMLVAHGTLDALLFIGGHPGPLWWPAFCAAYDLMLAALIFLSLRESKTA